MRGLDRREVLIEQFRVRSGSRELQFFSIISLNQHPITLRMTAAIILPGAFERVVIINRRQGFAFAKLVDNGFQFSHAKSALLASAEILLELARYGAVSCAQMIV